MKSYAAIQLEQGQDLVIEQIDIPDPSPTQVIVKLFSTGICHSQVHQMNDITTPRPLAFGHEATGVVTHIGDAVTHLKEGDHCVLPGVSPEQWHIAARGEGAVSYTHLTLPTKA